MFPLGPLDKCLIFKGWNIALKTEMELTNSMLADAMLRVQPPSDKGRRLKIYYITQPGVRPPSFICYCNNTELFHFSYLRYIENRIRSVFGLEGTPVRMFIKEREQDLV